MKDNRATHTRNAWAASKREKKPRLPREQKEEKEKICFFTLLYFRDALRASSHNFYSHNFYAHFLRTLLIRLILRSRDNLNQKDTNCQKPITKEYVVSFTYFLSHKNVRKIFCCRYWYRTKSISGLCGANDSSNRI